MKTVHCNNLLEISQYQLKYKIPNQGMVSGPTSHMKRPKFALKNIVPDKTSSLTDRVNDSLNHFEPRSLNRLFNWLKSDF